jgi:hypothetical protein
MEETRLRLVELGARAITGIPRNLRDEWPNYGLDRKRAILGVVLNKVTVYPQGSLAPFDPDLIDPDWKVRRLGAHQARMSTRADAGTPPAPRLGDQLADLNRQPPPSAWAWTTPSGWSAADPPQAAGIPCCRILGL